MLPDTASKGTAVRTLRYSLRAAWQHRALPDQSPVEGLKHSEPGVAGFRAAAKREFEIHCSIVVRTARMCMGLRVETAMEGSFCRCRKGSPVGHCVPETMLTFCPAT